MHFIKFVPFSCLERYDNILKNFPDATCMCKIQHANLLIVYAVYESKTDSKRYNDLKSKYNDNPKMSMFLPSLGFFFRMYTVVCIKKWVKIIHNVRLFLKV